MVSSTGKGLGDAASVERAAIRASDALAQYNKNRPGKSKDEIKLEHELLGIFDFFKGIWKVSSEIVGIVESVATSSETVSVMNHMVTMLNDITAEIKLVLNFRKWNLDKIDADIGDNLAKQLIENPMGIKLADQGKGTGTLAMLPDGYSPEKNVAVDVDNSKAIATIKRLLGFGVVFPMAASGLAGFLKAVLADRFPESVGENIGHMSEHLGINFFLGTLLEQIFETAVGRPLEEVIAKQTHPNRLDMMTARTLARQHKISLSAFYEALDNMGYPDNLKEVILMLDTQQLPTGEIATAMQNGAFNKEDVLKYLANQGYSNTDAHVLYSNYVTHAETSARQIYRAAARTSFRKKYITEAQFRAILMSVGLDTESITMEVNAANLLLQHEDQSISISMLKGMYQRNIEKPEVIRQELIAQGYSTDDVTDIFKLWDAAPASKSKHLPVAKILAYKESGVLGEKAAYDMLINMGYTNADANLLLNNPNTKNAKHDIPASRGTIVQAYKEKVLSRISAHSQLVDSGLSASAADLTLSAAEHGVKPKIYGSPGSLHLNATNVAAAIKYEVLEPFAALAYLENMGYDYDDALILVRIAMKGGELGDIPPVGGPPPQGPTDQGGQVSGGTQTGGKPGLYVPPSIGGRPSI